MMFKTATLTVAMLTCSLGMSGCGFRSPDPWEKRRPATHPVLGLVTLAGEPVEGATVVFVSEPIEGWSEVAAVGRTNPEGRFRLRTFRDGDGAVAGRHVVQIEKLTWIRKPPPAPGELPLLEEVSQLPARYRAAATSGLSATVVPAQPNECRFDLQK